MSIESIHQRLDAGTPGPWADALGPLFGAVVCPGLSNDSEYTDVVYGGRVVCESIGTADAALVAHAPTDLALLLEVAEAAREARDSSGVECADERLRYVVLQVDKEDLTRLVAALDALDAAE